MAESSLSSALRHFESAEANLEKAEKTLDEIDAIVSKGVVFGADTKYESSCLEFDVLLAALPAIDAWKPEICLMELDEIAQNRIDALQLGEFEVSMSVERSISEPSRLLREYRFRFDRKRRDLIRNSLTGLLDLADENFGNLEAILDVTSDSKLVVDHDEFDLFKENIAQIDTLLGSSVPRPSRWEDLYRHMHFGQKGDIREILQLDTPSVRSGLKKSMYGKRDPMPVGIEDLGDLVTTKPRGRLRLD